MSKQEIINLIDDLSIAALNWDLAKKNIEKCENDYKILLEKFNNEMEVIDYEKMIIDEEFSNAVSFADKIFKTLGVK